MTNIQKIVEEFEKLPHYRIFLKDQSNFLCQALNQIRQETLEEVEREIEGMKEHQCRISETGWSNISEEYRKQMEKYGTEKYREAISDIINLIQAKMI